ncbi:MAG: hypothetical protein GWN01_14565 [Nitrosopumilaceae archaeon]|nr:hypothetical protein [Nitrosopumilaceae archaeon]NIX62681.1 hypothetical protein [Nitrosopumilaceae archaeon]
MYEKECIFCGKRFVSFVKQKKYCSNSCCQKKCYHNKRKNARKVCIELWGKIDRLKINGKEISLAQ